MRGMLGWMRGARGGESRDGDKKPQDTGPECGQRPPGAEPDRPAGRAEGPSDPAGSTQSAAAAPVNGAGTPAFANTVHSAPLVPGAAPAVQGLRKSIMMINIEGHASVSLVQALEETGYAVGTVDGLPEALDAVRQSEPAVIVVCGETAPDVCWVLRRQTQVRILALLPQPTEALMVATLDAGADDCQPASIGKNEAVRRVNILARRRF